MVRQASGGIGSEAADRALQATLQTLAERLPRGEARHIAQKLPAELKPWIYTETDAEAFDIDEFLVRLAKREETDVKTALRHARAVFFALVDALSPEAMAHHSKPIARPGRRWQKRCTGCSTASRPKAGTPACRSSRPIRRAWPAGSPPARYSTCSPGMSRG